MRRQELMKVNFATRMLIAVAGVAAIMAAISVALAAQRRMTLEVGLWLVIIGLIPIGVNYLWWHRQYAKTTTLPFLYLNYTPKETIVLLVLVVLMILGIVATALAVM
jgi:hypothetical protein